MMVAEPNMAHGTTLTPNATDRPFTDFKRLQELEQENARLRKIVADLALDNAILTEIAECRM